VIRREQLVAAIQRIDASERELLWLSLRRRVPDAALARLYGSGQTEVARRRAAAIEHVADELGVQRGEDFGSVLTGLMEPETWKAVAPELAIPEPPPEPPPTEPPVPPIAEPERVSAVPPDVLSRPSARGRQRLHPLRWALAGAIVAGAVVAGIVVSSDGSSGHHARAPTFIPRTESSGGQSTAAPGAPCYFTAYIARGTELYRRPAGPPRVRLQAVTGWGSPIVLHVVVRRAAWLGVIAPQLRNGELGWLPARAAKVGCVAWSLDADLSSGVLQVRQAERVRRSVRVAAGARGRRMPTGRFAVTDRLEVNGRSAYGCCVLALSGHQSRSSHPGGDRLAIYAGRGGRARRNGLGTGALRASSADARWLVDNVPLGTPIFIRP
jgi:hypothetical protein